MSALLTPRDRTTCAARRRGPRSRAAWALGLLVLVPLFGACGDDADSGADAAPLPPAPSEPLWNPCTGLDPERVAQVLGTAYDQRTGTDSAPECTFTPQTEGAPVLDINYQLVQGSLDELVSTFGDPVHGSAPEVTAAEVPLADDARVITDVIDDTLLVSGFVQNGALVQLVNLIDPAPYQRQRAVRGVEQVLGDLAEAADESGLSER